MATVWSRRWADSTRNGGILRKQQ